MYVYIFIYIYIHTAFYNVIDTVLSLREGLNKVKLM